MTEGYFRYLKNTELQYDELLENYAQVQLEQKQQDCRCGFDLNPKSFSYILFSGVAIGLIGAYIVK